MTGGCEPHSVGAGNSNLGLLYQHYTILTTQPALQPSVISENFAMYY